MKSILKNKNPQNIDKHNLSRRDSAKTICLTELNDSKSDKTRNFIEDDQSERENDLNDIKLVKVHLKLSDLVNPVEDKKKNHYIFQNDYSNLTKKEVIFLLFFNKFQKTKKIDFLTTTDSSKEEAIRFKNNQKKEKKEKNEVNSSSSLSDFFKVQDIVCKNVILQQQSKISNKIKRQFSTSNRISEEASVKDGENINSDSDNY